MVVTTDNSTLIIAESVAQRLTAFDIADDGGFENRRIWADDVGPDGICVDAEGAIWTGVGGFGDNLVGRVREGGEVLETVQLDMPCFACMLGGEHRKTLFMLTADWRISDSPADNIARLTGGARTGRLLTAPGSRTRRWLALADRAAFIVGRSPPFARRAVQRASPKALAGGRVLSRSAT
jgi:sugar lactone lactonase YvrE